MNKIIERIKIHSSCLVINILILLVTFFSTSCGGDVMEHEIIDGMLYIEPDTSWQKYKTHKIFFSKSPEKGEDYVEFTDYGVKEYTGIYFTPPDTIYVLNFEGRTIKDIKCNEFKIIDVLCENLWIREPESELTATERAYAEHIRYDVDGVYFERINPATTRFAYKLTHDPVISKSFVSICFEPNLKGFTVCDSTGHPIAYSSADLAN